MCLIPLTSFRRWWLIGIYMVPSVELYILEFCSILWVKDVNVRLFGEWFSTRPGQDQPLSNTRIFSWWYIVIYCDFVGLQLFWFLRNIFIRCWEASSIRCICSETISAKISYYYPPWKDVLEDSSLAVLLRKLKISWSMRVF